MDTEAKVSKRAAGSAIGALLMGMCVVSAYFLSDGLPTTAAGMAPAPGTAAPDTLEQLPAPDTLAGADLERLEASATEEAAEGPDDAAGLADREIVEKDRLDTDAVAGPAASAGRAGQFIGAGTASYYGKRFAGKPTANGEIFDPAALTAAHPSLPFGTRVRVTRVKTGHSVEVRINDRGPYAKGRVIDLSRAAAERLQMIHTGTAKVTLELVPAVP